MDREECATVGRARVATASVAASIVLALSSSGIAGAPRDDKRAANQPTIGWQSVTANGLLYSVAYDWGNTAAHVPDENNTCRQ